jgi:hypothetical protein
MRLPSTDIQALPPILIVRAMVVQNKNRPDVVRAIIILSSMTRPASGHHRRDDQADYDGQ